MTVPPDEPAPEIERVVDAISEGAAVEWDSALADPGADSETLEALRLIDTVARMHRGGSERAPDPAEGGLANPTWGNLVLRGRLGAGVYGEVYRAFDPGLQREVALKLWSETVGPRTIERLLEEARALARVRHLNVLMVHGADVHDGRVGMWTELLEGCTLEELIRQQGAADWREAAIYGIELCRALAAVHAIRLVHGDVKAANVMRERGGRIVLMDFGSATAVQETGATPPPGVQGTPLAMAPEVLRGAAATPASDLYSLGVLLFRLVAARYPAEADSLEHLREQLERLPHPSLRALRPDVPVEFAQVVERALEREPGDRISSAAEMERLLAGALSSDWGQAARSAATNADQGRVRARRRAASWAAVVAVLVLSLAGLSWFRRGPLPAPARPMRFTLQLPLWEHLQQFANVVISPDGGSIVFASTDTLGHNALWLRRFDARGSSRIPGTEGAMYPFWSPDSRNIGFFSNGHLKRVGADGGNVTVICPAELGRGGTWSPLGTILFASSTQAPLFRVPEGGGTPTPATALDTANSEVSHRWPCFLPDGDHFLYVSTPARNGAYSLFAGSLHSDRRAYIGPVESGVAFSSGTLVYVTNRTLEARPFNVRTLRWSGDPVPISDLPGLGGSLAEPHASVSQNGTLVSSALAVHSGRLKWIDARTGLARTLSVGPYFHPGLSPDGRRIAVERVEGTGRSNLWMVDAQTGAAVRMTNDDGLNRAPVWSPAGDTIVFSSNRSGHYGLYKRSTGGSITESTLPATRGALMLWPNDWSPGGRLTLDAYEPGSGFNVYELRSGTAVPIARTIASEMHGAYSPDGRWLAFDSDASGRPMIHVVNLSTSEEFVLPGDGGMEPRWARATGRLFYHTPAGEFFEVTPRAGWSPSGWRSRQLFRCGVLEGYAIDADGRHVLGCFVAEPDRPEQITVLANLPQALSHGF